MKTFIPSRLVLPLLAAAFLFTHAAFAANGPKPPTSQPPTLENWQTVDDVQNAVNDALTVAPNGVIYAAGFADVIDEAGINQARAGVVRTSSDGGNTWSTASSFMYPGLRRGQRDCSRCFRKGLRRRQWRRTFAGAEIALNNRSAAACVNANHQIERI
jgi:hypothetical protein